MNIIDQMRAKRAKVMEDAAGLRKYPGTGYHDNDPLGPVKHPDPIGQRDAKLEDHIVAFKLPYETWFVNPDGERAKKLIQDFFALNGDLLQQPRLDQEQRRIIEAAAEYSQRPLSDGCFVVRNAQFNDVLAIFGIMDVGVTSTAIS